MVEIGPSLDVAKRQSQAISLKKSEVAQTLGNGTTGHCIHSTTSLTEISFVMEIKVGAGISLSSPVNLCAYFTRKATTV
jgi:hypothetical protein